MERRLYGESDINVACWDVYFRRNRTKRVFCQVESGNMYPVTQAGVCKGKLVVLVVEEATRLFIGDASFWLVPSFVYVEFED